ncbi:cytochrome c oxidase assembly factor Coa1 family protein [Faecalibacter bovis]|uniref:Cytochrome oxidase complex assembly protein 1 n=1 Tax=Faecalibacter bovis TaxID=2898187 RepID=A0ABX7XFW1_9FLAO|nr:cytochrome c oxidase assembly factor Coa1 family protein [Faecalibacter bovis]QTV06755.1 hypothetical protein J9309_05425 [Faecalibacter bovis]
MTDFDNELVKPKSWFNRNWKWAVPLGCLSTIGLFFVLLFGGLFFGVSKMMSSNDGTTQAVSIINQDQNVKEKLGENIETDGIFSGNISTSNNTGEMNISVPVKGSKGTGTAIIIAEKEFGKWNYEKIAVQIDETGEVIQIQKQY